MKIAHIEWEKKPRTWRKVQKIRDLEGVGLFHPFENTLGPISTKVVGGTIIVFLLSVDPLKDVCFICPVILQIYICVDGVRVARQQDCPPPCAVRCNLTRQ